MISQISMPKVKTSVILIKRKCKNNGEVAKSDLAVVFWIKFSDAKITNYALRITH